MPPEETKAIVFTPETAGLFVLLIETALRLGPIIAEGIANMNLPGQTKEEYKARINAAQESLIPWA
jgi:hypothetical protein